MGSRCRPRPAPRSRMTRFAVVVAFHAATLATGGRYPLPGPDSHRLDRASFAWRTQSETHSSHHPFRIAVAEPRPLDANCISRLILPGSTNQAVIGVPMN